MRRWTWPVVFSLVLLTFVAGVVLVTESAKDTAGRDIGTSFIGTSVTGFVFALVGQVLSSEGKRRDFLLNLSQKDDLTGIDLRGQDLSNLYLSGKNLARANLSGANLAGADLQQALLDRARLDRTVLANADLRGAFITGARLRFVAAPEARFDRAVMLFTSIEASTFAEASFSGARLDGVSCRALAKSTRWTLYMKTFKTGPRRALRNRRNLQRALRAGAIGGQTDLGRAKRELRIARRTARKRLLQGGAEDQLPVSFVRADFTGAVLDGADLAIADIGGAILRDIHWNERTNWPPGATPPESTERAAAEVVPPWRPLVFGDVDLPNKDR